MEIEIRSFSGSLERMASVQQMEDRFGYELIQRARKEGGFSGIRALEISAVPQHPSHGPGRVGRRFTKSTGHYTVDVPLDYVQWAKTDWQIRTNEYARALTMAVERVPKNRVSDDERVTLLKCIEETRIVVGTDLPEDVAAVGSTYVHYDENDEICGISFSEKNTFVAEGTRVVAVAPEETAFLAPSERETAGAEPEMFKLFQRIDGKLHYREAWPDGNVIVEHWGECGTSGNMQEHRLDDAHDLMKRLKKGARELGFRPIAPSRHANLVIEYAIDDFGDGCDIDRRHQLEDHLNELTGWLGLGYCDGGSIGSSTMEVFCQVVDFTLAREVLERELKGTQYDGFTRIYRL